MDNEIVFDQPVDIPKKLKEYAKIIDRIVDGKNEFKERIQSMDYYDATKLAGIIRRPDVKARRNTRITPNTIMLSVPYGQIHLDQTLTKIESVYVNGAKFSVKEDSLDAVEKMISGIDGAREVLDKQVGRQSMGRRRRVPRTQNYFEDFEKLQEEAYNDFKNTKITYENAWKELGGLLDVSGGAVGQNREFSVSDIMDELFSNSVPEQDIAQFLIYESQYKNEIVSRIVGKPVPDMFITYKFNPLSFGENEFLDKIMTSIGVTQDKLGRGETRVEWDGVYGALKITNIKESGGKQTEESRTIHNLPVVDEKGIFHNGETSYIPYYIGYFAEGEGTRVERLRVIDPVESAITGMSLQYELTGGDIKFQTILDVTRNLADYDNHPFGEEILDTLKNRKVVLDKSYLRTNSLSESFRGNTDDLNAVALTMLDDDADGVIDPYGTSNGENMGVIFYLTQDATVLADGSIAPGVKRHSLVGDIMNKYNVDRDNFNRQQMSFNALLTSKDVKVLKTAFCEFGMFNSEDAVVFTEKGSNQFSTKLHVGDKVTEMHGNKSVTALVVDPNMSDEEAAEQRLTPAVEFVRNNPDVDVIVSPISIASRLNMGVAFEGLSGEKHDLVLSDGSVVKDGVVDMLYFQLPQTAEKKSKNYEESNGARKFSTLYRYVLSSKIGEDLYNEVFMSDVDRWLNIDAAATALHRLGVGLFNDMELINDTNVTGFVDAPVTISNDSLMMVTPSMIRNVVQDAMHNEQYFEHLAAELGESASVKAYLDRYDFASVETDDDLVEKLSKALGLNDGAEFGIDVYDIASEVGSAIIDGEIDTEDVAEYLTSNSRYSNELCEHIGNLRMRDVATYNTKINIDLGDMQLVSPLTNQPIVDRDGRNVLPIRVEAGQNIPYRYNEVLKHLGLGNAEGLQKSFDLAAAQDMTALTKKDNLLKNINTMFFKEGAATTVIVPDPRLKIDEVRSNRNEDELLIHRDPCIQSGNVMAVRNVHGGEDNVLHTNPLNMEQVQGDYDGDTMGERGLNREKLNPETIDAIMTLASPYEGLNHYGEVFLGTNSSHFVAGARANGIDLSDLNFDDGKSPYALAAMVEDVQARIVDSSLSYGNYALSFTNIDTVRETLGRLADDGIKGKRDEIEHYLINHYTVEENRQILKALVAKQEWTGQAGSIVNALIAGYGDGEFVAPLVRASMDSSGSLTQAVLQMKKNADKLPEIDKNITKFKQAIGGKYSTEEARQMMLEATAGLIPPAAIETFVSEVEAIQSDPNHFGAGVFNNRSISTSSIAYVNGAAFSAALKRVTLSQADFAEIRKSWEQVDEPVELTEEDLAGLTEAIENIDVV